MKLAFERGDAPPPSTPTKGMKDAVATPKKTPAKTKVKSEDDGEDTPTTTPKRKRTPAKKIVYTEAEDEDGEQDEKPKRAKSTPKTKPRPKNAFRASDEKTPSEEPQAVVKEDLVDSDGDVFTDAPEQVEADIDAEGVLDEVCKCIPPLLLRASMRHFHLSRMVLTPSVPTSLFSEKFAHAREMANVLLDRRTRLNSEQRKEVEDMLEVLDDAV